MSFVAPTAAAPAPAAAAAWRAPGRPGYDASAAATERRVLPMLDTERVVWLSTVRPEGLPHLVPTWFWWDGQALVVFSKPEAVKVRNLRANPRLMVALGNPHDDFAVGLIEAAAEVADRPIPVPEAFFAKYAAELAAGDLDAATYRATYTQAVRIVPTRFLAWHGRGATSVPAAPAPVSALASASAPTSAPERRWRVRAPAGATQVLAGLRTLARSVAGAREPMAAPAPA
jgi:PPOX class probable F420-dependent enzyme